MSELDGHDSTFLAKQPLTLNTHLTIPQTLITDGPLTDSPTSGDLNDFPMQNKELVPELAAESSFNHMEMEYEPIEVLPAYPAYEMSPPIPEELKLSSPAPFDTQTTFKDPVLPPQYDFGQPLADTSPEPSRRFLDACRQYAANISETHGSDLTTLVEHAFDTTVLYYYKTHDDCSFGGDTMTLRKAWDALPTVEAALIAMNHLLGDQVIPTSYQLVSLAFFSLSLLTLSLNPDDLTEAVRILHHQAKSWSNLIASEHERPCFEKLIDNLWHLAEQDSFQSPLRDVAIEYSLNLVSSLPMFMDPGDLIIQVAQIFINCKFKV